MASLVLSDGTRFEGESFGADVDSDGEVVFTTGMAGYPESLTDPSFRGQILVFTYPLIGNYGVPKEELNEWGFSKNMESENIHVRGVVVAQASENFSHHEAVESFGEWLKRHNIPAITGVDTRALTKKLRETGVMLGRISSSPQPPPPLEERETSPSMTLRTGSASRGGGEIEDPNLRNLVAEVSCSEVITYDPFDASQGEPLTIIAYDCGMKRNIIRSFLKRGVTVIRVPWDFDLSSYTGTYDGLFISNGPGDPKMCTATIKNIQWALDKHIPTFGICLGNQLLALALGGDTYKLKYGHRGVNQPCVEEAASDERLAVSSDATRYPLSARCIITSQNHGFAVDDATLPNGWRVWFRNANDGTVEGIRHDSGRFFSVQFHPEATPGPEDANYLFDEFVKVMTL